MYRLTNLVKQHEGLRLKCYTCTAGKLTIGYGHNLEDNGISKAAAEFILQEDLQISIAEISGLVSNFESLSDVRQAVLVDMHFNLGGHRFSGFKKMIAAVESADFAAAAEEMIDSAWYGQVGNRSVRLVRMMRSNNWPD